MGTKDHLKWFVVLINLADIFTRFRKIELDITPAIKTDHSAIELVLTDSKVLVIRNVFLLENDNYPKDLKKLIFMQYKATRYE